MNAAFEELKDKWGTWSKGFAPKKLTDFRIFSQFLDNALAHIDNEEFNLRLRKMALEGYFTHRVKSNNETINNAIDSIAEGRADGVSLANLSFGSFEEAIAGHELLLAEALNKGDQEIALNEMLLLTEYAKAAGCAVQAFSILKKLTGKNKITPVAAANLLVLDYYKDSRDHSFQQIYQTYACAGKLKGKSAEERKDAERELIANFVEKKIFTDKVTARRLVEHHRNRAEKITDKLNDRIQKTVGSKEEKFLVDARNMFREMLHSGVNETAENKKSSGEEEEKLSLSDGIKTIIGYSQEEIEKISSNRIRIMENEAELDDFIDESLDATDKRFSCRSFEIDGWKSAWRCGRAEGNLESCRRLSPNIERCPV